MTYHFYRSLKVKISLLASLFIAIAFTINWQLAVDMIRNDKTEDLQNILHHVLIESIDEYLTINITSKTNVTYLQTIPHNVMILKHSEVNNLRFTLTNLPQKFSSNDIGVSAPVGNYYLNIISDNKKLEQAVMKYGNQLLVRYLITLFIFLIVTWIILQHYLTPLSKLAKQISNWKDDDILELSVDNVDSEIRELSISFSNLVLRLNEFRKKEKELFKEMAHELKTPIAIMKARIDVYENSNSMDKNKFICDLNNDVGRLISELKNILFFESSDFDLATKFQIEEVLILVIEKMEILAKSRGVHLFLCAENFEIFTSKKVFKKVLILLIENALTYAKQNSEIKINVIAERKQISITNFKSQEKFVFSSKIGNKILDRITKEINVSFEIFENEEIYCVNIFQI